MVGSLCPPGGWTEGALLPWSSRRKEGTGQRRPPPHLLPRGLLRLGQEEAPEFRRGRAPSLCPDQARKGGRGHLPPALPAAAAGPPPSGRSSRLVGRERSAPGRSRAPEIRAEGRARRGAGTAQPSREASPGAAQKESREEAPPGLVRPPKERLSRRGTGGGRRTPAQRLSKAGDPLLSPDRTGPPQS